MASPEQVYRHSLQKTKQNQKNIFFLFSAGSVCQIVWDVKLCTGIELLSIL